MNNHNPPPPDPALRAEGSLPGDPFSSLPGLLAGVSWATLLQQKNAAGMRRPQIKLDILGTFEGRLVVTGSVLIGNLVTQTVR